MDEDINNLEIKHRKEKKELQAQIQALKKVSKSDKTKKKELSAEIVRLEAELDARHKQELEQSNIKVENSPVLETVVQLVTDLDLIPKLKVSKAQKRRDKKSQQDKDRDLEIKLQEKENINGPRNIEIQTITAKLKELHFKIYPIASDGDCLYQAVSHQLQYLKGTHVSVNILRQNVSNYIREHKDDFLPFMTNPKTCDMLTDEEFDEYCEKISDSKIWGGQLEIRALSNYLKCPITVIQATGPESINQGTEYEGPPIVLTYHRHMYRLGEHYNSTQPYTED